MRPAGVACLSHGSATKVVDWDASCAMHVAVRRRLGNMLAAPMMLKVSTLRRHAGTFQHQSVEAFVQGEAVATEVYAPPKPDEFKETLDNVRAGKMSMMQSNRRKTRCMEWCLAEAIRTLHRASIASASTLSMSADGRQCRLLMYFSGACGQALQVRQGVLGSERYFWHWQCCLPGAIAGHH